MPGPQLLNDARLPLRSIAPMALTQSKMAGKDSSSAASLPDDAKWMSPASCDCSKASATAESGRRKPPLMLVTRTLLSRAHSKASITHSDEEMPSGSHGGSRNDDLMLTTWQSGATPATPVLLLMMADMQPATMVPWFSHTVLGPPSPPPPVAS